LVLKGFPGQKRFKGRALFPEKKGSKGFLNFTDLEGFHQKGSKIDDKSVDSVRNQDFFNAGLSPYPHTTTSRKILRARNEFEDIKF